MKAHLVHHLGERIEFSYGGLLLFSYVYQQPAPPIEAPKPYFHPLCTLAGDTLTNHRPADHPWQRGLVVFFL
ncbi:MAG: hypothetical protein HC898_05880 [Phycisphaerales bacterium]|nr:hypothetical protein [Phycisphaerales bacterium]